MNTSSTAQTFAIINDPVYTHIDDEIVVMSPKNELYYGLNAVGAEIWDLLESSPVSIDAIITHLKQRYDLDELQATTDVSTFIHEMMKQGLIEHR